jgi:hypothetical protein
MVPVQCTVGLLYVPEGVGVVIAGLGDRLPVLAGSGDQWWKWDPADEEGDIAMMADIRTLILDVGVPFLEELRSVAAVAERTTYRRLPDRPSRCRGARLLTRACAGR